MPRVSKKTGEPLIHWSKEEWQFLANYLLDKYGYGKWPLSIVAGAREAMAKMLPEARHRPGMKGADNVRPLTRLIEIAKKNHNPAAPKPTPVDVGALASTPEAEEQTMTHRRTIEEREETLNKAWARNAPSSFTPAPPAPESSVTDVLSTFIAGVLVDSVKKLLTNGDIARMLRSLQNGTMPEVAVASPPRHSPVGAASAVKERKLDCLVCGFKPHQQSELNARGVGLGLHLRFWYAEKPNEGMEVLRQKVQSADVVLFSMEATSHSAVNIAQSANKRIVRVTGGMSTMLEMLQKLSKEKLA